MNQIGTFSSEENSKIAVDNLDNIILIGEFQNTVDLDLSTGTNSVTSNGSFDFFIAKYDDSLNHLWGFSIGGISSDHITSVAIDSNNDIYITGDFRGFVDFDPSAAIAGFTATGGDSNIYIAKYTKDGDFLWAFPLGTTLASYGIDIVVDHQNNLLFLGEFRETIDFDPSVDSLNLTSFGGFDVCVAKYTSEGSLSWAFHVGGTSSDRAKAIDVYENGDFIITGRFVGPADFNPDPIETAILDDFGMFLAKYSADAIWLNSIGIKMTGGNSKDVKVDHQNEIVVTGQFSFPTDFEPSSGSFTLTPNGAQDIFLVKYDTNFSVKWGFNTGALLPDEPNSMWIDQLDNIYLTGFFSQVVDFDPSPNSTVLTSNGAEDIFFSKFSPNGAIRWAFGIGGSNDDHGLDLQFLNGKVFLTGTFIGTVDFNIVEPQSLNLTSAGIRDIFVGFYTDLDCLADSLSPQISNIDSLEYSLQDPTTIIGIPSIVATDAGSGIREGTVTIDSVATLDLSELSSDTYGSDSLITVPISMTDFTIIYDLVDNCDNHDLDTFYFSIDDNVAPEILALDINPTSLDLSRGTLPVNITIEAKDSISGLDSINSIHVDLILAPDNHFDLFAERISGDSTQGVYALDLDIPDNSQIGVGFIDTVRVIDKLSNVSIYTTSDLMGMGFPSNFEICNFSDSITNARIIQGLYLDGLDLGIKEKKSNGDCYKTTISNQGLFQTINASCIEGQNDFLVESGNLFLELASASLTLQSPDGSCWSIDVDNQGIISVDASGCPNTSALELQESNLFLSGAGNGIILKSPDSSCWILKVALNDQLKAFKINCP